MRFEDLAFLEDFEVEGRGVTGLGVGDGVVGVVSSRSPQKPVVLQTKPAQKQSVSLLHGVVLSTPQKNCENKKN
jgi:hypothetical protein